MPDLWASDLMSIASVSIVVLSACSPPVADVRFGSPSVMISEMPDGCGSAELATLVGQHYSVLADIELSGSLRVLRPGQDVTDQIDASRLNADVSDDGMIRHLFCG